jgi:hypothetical protein
MTEQKTDRTVRGLSTQWKVSAIGGIIVVLGAMLLYGFWVGLAALLVVFAILAIGKPFRRFRKFVYRAVCPAIALTLGIGWGLDMAMKDILPNSLQRIFVSSAIGLFVGITVVIILIALYAEIGLHWVTTLSPDIDKKTTRTLLRTLFLELNAPIMVVEDGQIKTTREAGPGGLLQKFGESGLLYVHHGNAVVLERAGKFTRIARAGSTFLEPYEHPRAVVNLRPQGRTIHVEGVYTRDGVVLSIDLGIFYQIRRAQQPVQAQVQPLPTTQQPQAPIHASEETLRQPDLCEMAQQASGPVAQSLEGDRFPVADQDVINAVYNVFSWQGATEAVAAYILRDVIAELDSNAIYTAQRAIIRQEVRKRLNDISIQWWGTEVTWVRCVNL